MVIFNLVVSLVPILKSKLLKITYLLSLFVPSMWLFQLLHLDNSKATIKIAFNHHQFIHGVRTKIQHTKMLVTCQKFVDLFLFGLVWQFRQNILKVGSKSWLLTCSSNITWSLPSYTGSALKRELHIFL